MRIEICANSFDSALAAQQGGADRIELCTELSVGGLTPSHGLVEKVMAELKIPVHVLIRPRSGNFTYSATELDVMLHDIQFCEQMGCAGIVSGALNADTTVATKTLEVLLAASQAMTFTFHRAFDWCADPFAALEKLQELPVNILLTSGQQPTAEKGLLLLLQLKERVGKSLEIMPGSGINNKNIGLFKAEKFESIHLSASEKKRVLSQKPKVSMHANSLFEEGIIVTSKASIISEIVSVCRP